MGMESEVHYAFLHGGAQGGWVWDDTIAALERQRPGLAARCRKLDVPGCGEKRGRDTRALTVADIISELDADLAVFATRDIVLVGHSQAGNLMPSLAALRPHAFRRLIYVSCSIPLPGQSVLQMMGGGVHGSHPDEVGWPADSRTGQMHTGFQKMFCNDMPADEGASFSARLGRDAWPDASYRHSDWQTRKPADLPASYVICLRDNILPVAWQETFARRFDAKRVLRIDAGHQVMKSRPHALAEVLRVEARIASSAVTDPLP